MKHSLSLNLIYWQYTNSNTSSFVYFNIFIFHSFVQKMTRRRRRREKQPPQWSGHIAYLVVVDSFHYINLIFVPVVPYIVLYLYQRLIFDDFYGHHRSMCVSVGQYVCMVAPCTVLRLFDSSTTQFLLAVYVCVCVVFEGINCPCRPRSISASTASKLSSFSVLFFFYFLVFRRINTNMNK